jgi:hypothetical protein
MLLVLIRFFLIAGHGLTYIIYTFLSVVPDLRPFYFLLASIPVALSGGLITVISGMYAYTSDITSAEKRSFRYQLVIFLL